MPTKDDLTFALVAEAAENVADAKLSQAMTENIKGATSSVGAKAAELVRKREEMEAREARQNKNDFVDYCAEVLTQHKNADKSHELPDKKQKFKVLQSVIDDPAQLQREEGREPTVAEYGKFIRAAIKEKEKL